MPCMLHFSELCKIPNFSSPEIEISRGSTRRKMYNELLVLRQISTLQALRKLTLPTMVGQRRKFLNFEGFKVLF